MFIKIICIVAVLEFSISEYDANILPMDKDSKYGDDVCHYFDNKKIYVKPCEKGKFCDENEIATLDYVRGKDINDVGSSSIGICREFPKISPIFTFNEKGCTNDFECESPYKCIDNVCTKKCQAGYFLAYNGNCYLDSLKISNDEICYEKTLNSDLTEDEKYSPPNANKECGKIVSFADLPVTTEKGIYYVNKQGFAYPGEVEDGEYVTNDYFCKSGFALYFFKDGKTEDPRDTSATQYNEMNLRCVTPISISSNYDYTSTSPTWTKCLINYKIKEDGEILRYNVLNIPGGYSGSTPIDDYCSDSNRDYIKLRSEKYREFYTKISEEERKTCGDLDNTNKYTCENNELIKLWYIYTKTKDFLNYNNRKKIGKVLEYNIQQKYPCYSLSQFLSIKFIYLLILLFF